MNYDHVTPEWIKQKLREHEMTQEELGIELGIKKGARHRVNNWINDKKNMSITTKAAIAGVFYRIERERY
jgi:transcriptional regulator with XRE-family HTH domain